MKEIVFLVAVFFLSMFGFSSAALANCSIKVCHCSGSQVASSVVGLNNMDGNGVYAKTTIDRGSCKTLHGSITGCFVEFKHYEANSGQTTDSALSSGEVAYGWEVNPDDPDGPYDYELTYGGRCD